MTSPPRPRSPSGDAPGARRPTAMQFGACAGLAMTGLFVAVGCLLALYLDLIGSAGPTEEELSGVYTASLLVGAAAGLLLPAYLARLVVRGRYRTAAGTLAAVIAASAAAVSLLGTWG